MSPELKYIVSQVQSVIHGPYLSSYWVTLKPAGQSEAEKWYWHKGYTYNEIPKVGSSYEFTLAPRRKYEGELNHSGYIISFGEEIKNDINQTSDRQRDT